MTYDKTEMDVKFIHATENGVLLEFNEDEAWFPRSHIEDFAKQVDNLKKGDEVTLEIADWLLEKHNWI